MRLSRHNLNLEPEDMAELYYHPQAKCHPHLATWCQSASSLEIDRFLKHLPPRPELRDIANALASAAVISDYALDLLAPTYTDLSSHRAQRTSGQKSTPDIVEAITTNTQERYRQRVDNRGLVSILSTRADVTDALLAEVYKHVYEDSESIQMLGNHPNAGPLLVTAMLRNEESRDTLLQSSASRVLYTNPILVRAFLKALLRVKYTRATTVSRFLRNVLADAHTSEADFSTRLTIILDLATEPANLFTPDIVDIFFQNLAKALASPTPPILSKAITARLLALSNTPSVTVPPELKNGLFANLRRTISGP